jgi:hypothetical protein
MMATIFNDLSNGTNQTVQEFLAQVLDSSISENNKLEFLNEKVVFLQTSLQSANQTIENYETVKQDDLNEKLVYAQTALNSANQTIEDYEEEFRGFEGLLFEKRKLWDQVDFLTKQV